MDTFSSHAFSNICLPRECYPSDATLHEYVNRETLLRRTLFESEFDCFSDVSVDSSSSFSVNRSEYLNWAIKDMKNQSLREESLGGSLMQYGRGNLTTSESPQSSLWSDDDISEFLSFDQTGRFSPQMMVDPEEEQRYLSELLRQDIIATQLGWCNLETIEDRCFNIDRKLREAQGDTFSTPTYFSHNFEEYTMLNKSCLLQKEGAHNFRGDDIPVKTNHVTDPTLRNPNRNPNSRNNNPEVQSPGKIQRQKELIPTTKKKESSSTQVSKNNDNKKCKTTDDDDQRVFLGGLPIGITERTVRQNLAALGYKVLKRPKILHGFAPEVWMKTVEQAKDLVEKGTVVIEGLEVEVRPYNSLTKLSELKKLPNVGKRSVFIGGMSADTTTKQLQDALSEMGMKVINYPVIKHGFARQVILDTISQAKTLIKMKQLQVDGTIVDVRPFINQKRRRTKKN